MSNETEPSEMLTRLPSFADISSASKQVATYSAMNPILWKTVICSPIGLICSVIAPSPLSYLLFALSALPILVGCWGFVHFARTDPRRLQSEGHIEHMEMLSRIGDNERKEQLVVEGTAVRSSNTAVQETDSD